MILELQGVGADGPSEAAATFFGFMGVAISLSFASKLPLFVSGSATTG